jgi:hypothetical protein
VLTTHLQNGVQQEILRPMRQQALTKIHQDAGVNALIIQRLGEPSFKQK